MKNKTRKKLEKSVKEIISNYEIKDATKKIVNIIELREIRKKYKKKKNEDPSVYISDLFDKN